MRFVRGGNLIDLDWLVEATSQQMPLAMNYAEAQFALGKSCGYALAAVTITRQLFFADAANVAGSDPRLQRHPRLLSQRRVARRR